METVIVALFLLFFFLESAVELGLNEANTRHVRKQLAEPAVPDWLQGQITAHDYRRALDYTVAKGGFQRWADIYGRLVLLLILFGGALPSLDDLSRRAARGLSSDSLLSGILFCLGTGLLFSLLHLPADVYRTFGIEQRFGFNKTSPKLYFLDKVKGLILGLILGTALLGAILWLMSESGGAWWLWAFLVILAFQLLMIVLYPTLIAPLFNKFEPLKEGDLRARLLALAEQTGFKTSGIYVMDGSRRSTHSNAYFTGIGKAKRIVLFDTLTAQLTAEQGAAVLAHEIGHYKMKHIRRMLLIETAFLFTGLYILSRLADYPPLFRSFGLGSPFHAGALVLCTLLSGPFSFYLHPLLHYVSRRHEYEADRYAARTLRNSRAMIEALIRLTIENLSNPQPHPWYSAYHYTHPTTGERIRALQDATLVAS